MVLGKIHQIFRGQARRKFFFQKFRVCCAHAKTNERAHIAKHRRAYFFIKLFNVLVRNDKVKPILAGFRENICKTFCGKILKLIDIKIKILALFFRSIDTLHCRKLDLRDKHSTQKTAIIFADAPLCKI